MTARSVTARNVSFIDLSAGWFALIVAAKVWFTRAQMPERRCASDLHPHQGITCWVLFLFCFALFCFKCPRYISKSLGDISSYRCQEVIDCI